jgi:hypothetical protein
MFNKMSRSATALLASLALPAHADAAQGNVQFHGNVARNNACEMVLDVTGVMAQSPDGLQLGSKLPGARSAEALVFCPAAGTRISVDGPSSFLTFPAGGNAGTTFVTTYRGTYGEFAERPGNVPFQFPQGARIQVTIDVMAIRTSAFPEGSYSAIATVRLE